MCSTRSGLLERQIEYNSRSGTLKHDDYKQQQRCGMHIAVLHMIKLPSS